MWLQQRQECSLCRHGNLADFEVIAAGRTEVRDTLAHCPNEHVFLQLIILWLSVWHEVLCLPA